MEPADFPGSNRNFLPLKTASVATQRNSSRTTYTADKKVALKNALKEFPRRRSSLSPVKRFPYEVAKAHRFPISRSRTLSFAGLYQFPSHLSIARQIFGLPSGLGQGQNSGHRSSLAGLYESLPASPSTSAPPWMARSCATNLQSISSPFIDGRSSNVEYENLSLNFKRNREFSLV